MENSNQFQHSSEKPVSVGDWIVTILLMAIPLVGFIMLFVWAFGSNTPASKANWAKASLIWMLIGIVLGIALWGTVLSMFSGLF